MSFMIRNALRGQRVNIIRIGGQERSPFATIILRQIKLMLMASTICAAHAVAMPASPSLYGLEVNLGGPVIQTSLIRINTNTGAASTIGAVGTGYYQGLGTYNNGLYAVRDFGTGTSALQHIDPTSAAVISTTTVNTGLAEGGFDIDSNGRGFAIDNFFRLVRFSVLGGPATVLGGPTRRVDTNQQVVLDGLAFGVGDILYGYSQELEDPEIYMVDQINGMLIPLGNFLDSGGLGGLAARLDDVLFGVHSTFGLNNPDDLYSFDLSTKSVAKVGSLGAGHINVTGLTFLPENVVPEPATLGLVGIGTLILALTKPRRKISSLISFSPKVRKATSATLN